MSYLVFCISGGSQPNLKQYFSDARDVSAPANSTPSVSFFDQLSTSNFDERGEDVAEGIDDRETAVLHSCRESRVDLTNMETNANAADTTATTTTSEAKLDVAEQVKTVLRLMNINFLSFPVDLKKKFLQRQTRGV